MLAIDTNMLVRLLARDDVTQAQQADRAIQAGAWVSHLALVETLWVLESLYERKPSQLIAIVQMLLAHEHLVVQDPDTVRGALANFSAKPSLGFSDCLMLEVAKRAGHTPLATFDKALSKLPGTVLVKA
jgi:predicted nucleic-acid-binding protein